MKPKIKVLDLGVGNLQSVSNALCKAGALPEITGSPDDFDCNGIVLPGVGAFGPSRKRLDAFEKVLRQRQGEGVPLLGICLGLQLFFEASLEGGESPGLGFFKGKVVRFEGKQKIPQMGWNTLEVNSDCPLFENVESGSFAYFVHSYYAKSEKEVVASKTNYCNQDFASAVWRKNVFAVQFHPEKSGEVGLRILKNFVELCD
ncbi:MAG: imidazole glycerol phosphate synthase subunit HisH [Candidatus Micrarchaeia archaeon]